MALGNKRFVKGTDVRSRRNLLITSVFSLVASFAGTALAQDLVDMDGKTALITGSTSGLGREVALRLGSLGATVIVHGRNEERGQEVAAEINAAGPGRAVFYRADLASLAEVRALAERVLDQHGRLDLLINNAGVGGASNDPRRTSADGHEFVFAVNYLSHFLLTRELLPLLEASAPARIVNVASIGQRAVDFDDVMMTENYNQMRVVDMEPYVDPGRIEPSRLGYSRGHWEDDTLVVETTNYNGEVGMTNVGIPGSPRSTRSSRRGPARCSCSSRPTASCCPISSAPGRSHKW